MVDIFLYQDYRKYLRDYYQKTKKNNPAFSFRFFAKRAALPSFNYLKLVMDGKRNLTPSYTKRFIQGLKLKSREAQYFETLVQINQSRDVAQLREAIKRLFELKQRVTAFEISQDQAEVYSEWHHWAIREMVLLKDFKDDPKWISQRLGGIITPTQAKKSLTLLLRLGLIERRKGKLTPTYRAIKTSDEIENFAIKKLHESFISQALYALFRVPLTQKEFAGLTICLPESKIPWVKGKIKELRKELNEILSAEENLEEVYQLNIQFYPLTRRDK